MPQIYRAPESRDPIDAKDGAPSLKGCTLFGPPASAAVAGDADLTVPDDVPVTRCPPGVAQGASSWSWRSSDGIGATGRRTPAQGGT